MTQDPFGRQAVKEKVRTYILSEFLAGEDPELLTDTTSLIRGGILDSIASTRLVSYLEDTFGVSFLQKDVRIENLDSIDQIAGVVCEKLSSQP